MLALVTATLTAAACGGRGGGATGVIPPLVTTGSSPTPPVTSQPPTPPTQPTSSTTPGPAGSTTVSTAPSTPSSAVISAPAGAIPAADVEAAVRTFYRTAAQVLRDNDLAPYEAITTADCTCLTGFRRSVQKHRKDGSSVQGGDAADLRIDIQSRSRSTANAIVHYRQERGDLVGRDGKVIVRDTGAGNVTDSVFFVVVSGHLRVSRVIQLGVKQP